MTVPARVSLVTLGVPDVARATEFYVRLGWPLSSASVEGEVSFFRMAGAILGVWDIKELAADANLEDAPAADGRSRAVALAINCDSRAQVDAALRDAEAAGATILKSPVAQDWGGYSGYFADPDGNAWEVAHNPDWPIGDDELPQLPV
jgi:catechol 2,3-dioxygenase-like lactoylglutathione lyase family enzyme